MKDTIDDHTSGNDSEPPINTIEEILNKVLMVWKQDYPKPKGNSLDMDGYFERLEQSKIEATQAIEGLLKKEYERGLKDGQSS